MKAVFELRCACLIGYAPQLSACVLCGGEPQAFSAPDGGAVCKTCRPALPPLGEALGVLRYICAAPDKRVFLFKVSDEILARISPICEGYLLNCVEFIPNSLEMYKKLVTI